MKVEAWFYNARVGRRQSQLDKELRAILSKGPAVLALCEVIGYRLPSVQGYQMIRDTSEPGRANLAAYVRVDLDVTRIRWIDCHETWSKPKGPGRHWPRRILTFFAGEMQLTVVHQPPRWVDNEYPAQKEGLAKLTHLMAPWTRGTWAKKTREQRETARQRPRAAIGDYNRTGEDSGPGPAVLAEQVDGRVVPGGRIDCAVLSGQIEVLEVTRPDRVAGVEFKSDHPHALRLVLEVPREWINPKETS